MRVSSDHEATLSTLTTHSFIIFLKNTVTIVLRYEVNLALALKCRCYTLRAETDHRLVVKKAVLRCPVTLT